MSTFVIDKFNLYLLLLAFLIAYIIPFELLLISYAFLGPLHYLTEISWLHDRKYFTLLPKDPIYLTVGSFVLLLFGAAIFPTSSEFVWILVLVAFCTAFIRSLWLRLLIIMVGLILLVPWLGSTTSYVMAVLIPTVIHVFIFTLFFMFLGALKSNSRLGIFNTLIFFGGGILLLLLPQLNIKLFDSFVAQHYSFFAGIANALSTYFEQPVGVILPAIASFLAFTYTYHYLNWFSKTSIIEWHHISLTRSFTIGFLYAVSIGLYLYDYALGFTVLLSLSFLHVVLEFPLNFRSVQGIYKTVRQKILP